MYGDRHNTQTTRNKPETQPEAISGITPEDLLALAVLLLVMFVIALSVGKYLL